MIKIEPWDDLDDVNCRWKIEGWELVFEKDLVKELRLYARKLQDAGEGHGRVIKMKLAGERQKNKLPGVE